MPGAGSFRFYASGTRMDDELPLPSRDPFRRLALAELEELVQSAQELIESG